MKVSELMNPRVVKVDLKTPLREILELMLRTHLNDIVVVNNKAKVIGIISYTDIGWGLMMKYSEYMKGK